MDAVTNVNDWNMLGQGLNMPQAVLGEIHLSYHIYGIPRMKTELFSRWLARDPEASWIKVEAALRRMGHNTEADGVRERYLGGASTGGAGIHCIIHAVVVHSGQFKVFSHSTFLKLSYHSYYPCLQKDAGMSKVHITVKTEVCFTH